jgi:hypothetical protein
MTRVLSIASYTFLPAHTGGQKGIALFNKYFSRNADFISITTKTNQNDLADYPTIALLSGGKSMYINIFYFFTIRKHIRTFHISHLLLEHPYYGWLGILLKYACNVKLIVHSHNIECLRWKELGKWWWRLLSIYEKATYRAADFIFFITDEDKIFAIKNFKLTASRCTTITYGTEISRIPAEAEKKAAKDYLRQKHGIPENEVIILFNGVFNYAPNTDALYNLLQKVNPLLMNREAFSYKIVICGKYLPDEITSTKFPNVIFANFVEDITVYLKGADVFLNPVITGGGIKTKLIEALAYNLNVVSTQNGAVGVDPSLCNHKLSVVPDKDWSAFAETIVKTAFIKSDVPEQFFDSFFWERIAKKAASFIN